MTLPANVDTGRVEGRFIVGVIDGPDADDEPDAIPAQGTITFTASVPYLPNPSASTTILKAPIVAVLDSDGHLCTPLPDGTAGARGVRLIATDDEDLSVTGWTWTVTYAFESVNGVRPQIASHSMALPSGAAIDLTTVVRVPSSTGIGIPQAEALAASAQAAAAEAAAAALAAAEAAQATDAGVATLLTTGAQTAPLLDVKVDRGDLTLSVADYPTPNDAVAAALAEGALLYWPPGRWITNSSIPGLHQARNHGPGSLSRGTTVFYPAPTGGQTNTIYVSPTGTDAEDGITSGRPLQTLQAAFDVLANYGPNLDGVWQINLAAGTYPATEPSTLSTPSRSQVIVQGPAKGHPNVPTAIIDGADGAPYSHGVTVTGAGVTAFFRDILFQNFTAGTGDTTRIGLNIQGGANAQTSNVHAKNCSWTGLYAFNAGNVRFFGGIFENNRSAIVLNASHGTVGRSAEPVIIRSSTESGIYWSRGSQGHLDYATVEDNVTGLSIDQNSRCHAASCTFKRNGTGVKIASSGSYTGSSNAFSTGTTDANAVDRAHYSFGAAHDEAMTGTSVICVASDREDRISTTAEGSYQTMATPYTLPAGRLKAAGAAHVFLAGRPGDHPGVDGHVFAGCDAVAVLSATLDRMGVS